MLIAGLGLAMTLVVLAVVLNTVIFTQNLATREAVDTRSPVEFTNAVDQGVGGLLVQANHWNTTDYGTLDGAFRQAVTTWAGNSTRLAASKGISAQVTLEGTTNGTRVVQHNSTRPWTDNGTPGASTWVAAASVNDTRRFHANVTRSSLVSHDETGLSGSGVARVVVTNGSTWTVYIYRDATDSDRVNVTAVDPSGTKTTCGVTHPQPTIDLTEGAIDGTPCGFSFAENVSSPYQITVENGENVTGRYTFVVDTDYATFTSDNGGHYDLAAPYSSPFAVHAIYAAEMNVSVERSDVTYQRTIPVAPEDLPRDERYNVST